MHTSIGLLLAAGFGSRYAQASAGQDKLLARLPGQRDASVALAAGHTLITALPATLAVLRAEQTELATALQVLGCQLCLLDSGPQGIGISLAAGVRWLLAQTDEPWLSADRVVIALADMPWIKSTTLTQLLHQSKGHLITAPVFEKRRGHPVVFSRALWPVLANLAGDGGAQALLNEYGFQAVSTTDSGILRDVDLPVDLHSP